MTITAQNIYSAGGTPVLRATSDSAADEYEDVTVTIDNSDLTGPPTDTVITAKCLGGDIIAPAASLVIAPTDIKVEGVGSATSGNTYNISPVLVECNNGDILAIYGTGTAHRGVEDNIVYKRLLAGADKASGWGAEIEIVPAGVYGARHSGGGIDVDPVTGRVMVFYIALGQVEDDFATFGFFLTYSDDHGVTWSTPVDHYPAIQAVGTSKFASIYPVGSPDTNPDMRVFGRIPRTSNGLMLTSFCPRGGGITVVFSQDGITWDWAGAVVAMLGTTPTGGAWYGEPNVCAIDEDNIVLVFRNDTEDWKAGYISTTDGGLTWSSFGGWSEYYDYTALAPSGAAPVQVHRVGNRVYAFATGREPVGQYYLYAVGVDEFLADPSTAWSRTKTDRLTGATPISPPAENYLNAGYGSIIAINGQEYTALLAYYSPSSNGDNYTNITVRTMLEV